MAKVNEITFCEEQYKRRDDVYRGGKEYVDYDEMFEDIKSFIQIAVKNDYQMKVWFDGLTVVVEYDYRDGDLGDYRLEWIDVNEPDSDPEDPEE